MKRRNSRAFSSEEVLVQGNSQQEQALADYKSRQRALQDSIKHHQNLVSSLSLDFNAAALYVLSYSFDLYMSLASDHLNIFTSEKSTQKYKFSS